MDYTTSTSLLATDTLNANGEFTHFWLDKFDLRLSADKTEYGVFVLETLNKSFDNFKDAQQLYIELCQETLGYCSINPQPTNKTKKTTKLSEIKKQISKLLNYGHSDLLIWQTIQSSAFNHNDVAKEVLNRLEVKTGLDFSEMNWRKTETWQLVLEMIKEVQGVNESLGSQCGGVTVATVNASETSVNYIVTLADCPQVVIKDGFTPKYLDEVTDEELSNSTYTDKVTAEMMFPGSYYQVIEVNPENIRQQLTKHFNLEQDSIVATVTSDNKFKGIPVEHYSNYDWKLKTDDLDTVTISPWLVDDEYLVTAGGQTSFQTNLVTAVEIAKNYLATGVNTVKVPSTPKRLTAKLELFALMTEFVFLMQCYLEFIGYFSSTNYDVNLTEIGSELYQAWRLTTNIFSNRYVLMPTISADTYTKLLLIHLEATTGYSNLESKSIYA